MTCKSDQRRSDLDGYVFAWLRIAVEWTVPLAALLGAFVAWRRGARRIVPLALFLVIWSSFAIVPHLIGVKNLFPGYRYVSSDGGFKGNESFKSTACSSRADSNLGILDLV